MTKQIIAVDIDEVLSPLHDLVFAHHNAVYGTNYPIRDPAGHYYLDEYSDESNEVILAKIEKYVRSDEFQAVKPLAGAAEAIQALQHDFDLVIVTSRQEFYEEFTHHWLETHFPNAFKHVQFTAYMGREGLHIPKSDFCKRLGASYMIDDNIGHAFECAAAGIDTLLFGDYPWNQSAELPPRVTRAKNWPAVLGYFTGQKGKSHV